MDILPPSEELQALFALREAMERELHKAFYFGMEPAMTEARNLNIEKLIKMLNMTTSSMDQEALTAMRMVNQHLKDNKWTWDEILRGKITVAADPFMTAPIPAARFTPSASPQQAYRPQQPAPQPQQPYHFQQPRSSAYPKPKAQKKPKPKRQEVTFEDLGL